MYLEFNAINATIGESFPTSLSEVVIGENVLSIPSYFIYNNTNITGIIIPESITSIGNYAFSGCSALTSINIPANVISIGDYAFRGCTALQEIHNYNSIPPAASTNTFTDVKTNRCVLYVPIGSSEDYAWADGWSEFTNIVEEAIVTPGTDKCETPTIRIVDGAIHIHSNTEGATYLYSIKAADDASSLTASETGVIALSRQYVITAYAVADGYDTSEPATLTITLGDGDLNGDGETNVSDVTKLVSIILGNQ